MKPTASRFIPLLFIVVSLLYLAFSLSLESRHMIGDEQGWDPGSRALPVAVALLMLGLSVYLTFRESARASAAKPGAPLAAGPRRLVLLTIGSSLLYILAFVPLGFVLSTQLLVFSLVYFNEKQDVTPAVLPGFAIGSFGGLAFILALYSVGRLITRGLFLLGRARNWALLVNRSFAALVVLAVSALLVLLLVISIRPSRRPPSVQVPVRAALVAAGTTELLYLVFKQIFFVGLARGLIPW